MGLERVVALQDESGDWYVIPVDLRESFFLDNENMDDTGDKFENKYGEYKTGGDLNLIPLYCEFPDKLAQNEGGQHFIAIMDELKEFDEFLKNDKELKRSLVMVEALNEPRLIFNLKEGDGIQVDGMKNIISFLKERYKDKICAEY